MSRLIDKSIYILRETSAQFTNPAVLWSTGKDSTTVLSLIREAFLGDLPWSVIHIDTGCKFPEIYEFRDRIAKKWNLNLRVIKSDQGSEESLEVVGRLKCCQVRKTTALQKIIAADGFDAIIVSIRRDEHGIRNKERYMSPRDKMFRWKVWTPDGGKYGTALQDTELSGWNLYESYFGENVDHVRVHPILDWSELDVWKYIRERELPFNPLYRANYVRQVYGWSGKRFRSLGCMPCTDPVSSNASTIDEIIEELEHTETEERAGRAQDKEESYAMEKLRALGYM